MMYGKVIRKMQKLFPGGTKGKAPEKLVSAYEERLAFQRDLYGRWIREREQALWRQWEETLRNGQKKGRKNCQVIPYGKLSGITELSQLIALDSEDTQGQRRPDILLFADNPEDLDERAAAYVEHWFRTETEARLLYGAEDHKKGQERSFPWFKPCFSPDTLLGFFYFGSYFAVDSTWAMGTQLAGYEDAKQNLYDFVLRLLKPYYEKERLWCYGKDHQEIACTDFVLYHRSGGENFEALKDMETFQYFGEMRGETNAEFWGYEREYTACRQELVNSICGGSEIYETMYPSVWSLIPAVDKGTEDGVPLVSVVIPSKDHPKLLKKCIGSFLEHTSLPGLREKVEFIVVDNGSGEKNRQTVQNFLASAGILYHYLYQPMAFNFSAMCNLGAEQAKGTYILLLNDDIEIVEENWLRILLGQAQMPGMGAIGAKLRYPDGNKIQHAGVTNMSAGPSHKLMAFPDNRCYYYGHNTVNYDMIAVTGACLLVRKSVYEETGGLDEELAVAYNDVDFCLSLAEAGLRNVVRNDALLVHHESASRGMDGESDEKWRRLSAEKARLYEKHPSFAAYDPYYSRQLAGDTLDYHVCSDGCNQPRAEEAMYMGKKTELQKSYSSLLMLTIDQIKSGQETSHEEPGFLELEGWCYMMGWDNCLFERYLILEAEGKEFYYQIPVEERFRPDVEAALPGEKHIELSGFLCSFKKEKLIPGSYKVGMLYRNLCGGRSFMGRSNKSLQI